MTTELVQKSHIPTYSTKVINISVCVNALYNDAVAQYPPPPAITTLQWQAAACVQLMRVYIYG
jgi:hypothetical protein